jgi:hypothetical protein
MSSIDTPQSQPADLSLVSPESIQQITVVFPDILLWPESWMGDEHDLVVGHLILDVFIAYIAHLVENGRARSTLKKHANYLWALGGEIIRDTSEAGFDKCKPSYDFVLSYVDNLGGPYWRHASSEEDQLRYDSVCRALYRLLKNKLSDR